MGIFSAFKNGFRKVLDWGNTAKNYVVKGYNFVKKIPVIGGMVDKLVDQPLPIIGMSARQLGGIADQGLSIGNDIQRIIDPTPLPQTPMDRYKYSPLPQRPRIGMQQNN